MFYNIKYILKTNVIFLLCFLACFFITNILADTPNEIGISFWKSKIFINVNNVFSINILDFDRKIETQIIKEHEELQNNKLFTDETVSIYELTMKYKLPKVTDHQNSIINSYLLFFFKRPNIYINNTYIKIGKAVYPTKFATFHEVSTCNTKINTQAVGMISFVSYNNLIMQEEANFPLNCQLEKKLNDICLLDKVITIGCNSARQTRLQAIIEHENILSSKQTTTSELNLLPIPKITFLTKLKINAQHYTIDTLLADMHGLTSAVAYLHENNIAHGNISMLNLFIVNDRLVLTGFEDFSKFNEENDTTLGLKNLCIPSNMHYPPEFKNPLDSKKCGYGYASFAGDIWCLGLVLATILYNYQNDILKITNKLAIGNELELYNRMQAISANYVEPYKVKSLFSPWSKLKDNITNFKMRYNRNSTRISNPKNFFEHNLAELIIILSKCHNKDPQSRPSADYLKNHLSIVIDSYGEAIQTNENSNDNTSVL